MRTLARLLLVGAVSAAPVVAQVRDTTNIRRTPAGWVLDFQQQPLRLVLNALAEAGGLNLTTVNIPARNIDLRMGQGLDRNGIVQVLKAVATANGLRVIDSTSIITVEGTPPTPPGPTTQQLLAQQQAQQATRLYTYRLRHASAIQLAPVLMNLFAGVRSGVNNTQTFPGGFQINIPNLPGRGGGAGDVTFGAAIGQQFEALAAVEERAAANQGRQGAGGGGNAANRVGNILGQALGTALGTQGNQQGNQGRQGGAALSASAGDVRIVAEETSNSLLIRASEQDYALVQQILATVDLRPLQVLIEVTIAEVTRTDDLNIGISADAKRTPKGKTAADATAVLPGVGTARDFVLKLTGGKGTIDFNVAINALASRGDLKVLSMPVIIAQNNRQAVLNVGSSRPFVQVTQQGGLDPSAQFQTVQYIDVGTVLTITPTINPDGYVNLQVSQTANSATNEVQFNAPVISKREATTQVFVRDGQTTVIGGLADNSNKVSKSGIPFLRDIPLLGWLFRGTQQSKTTSELFLFLTPHVITSDTDLDRLREAIQDGSELLQQVPVGGRIVPKPDTISVPPAVRPPVRPPA